MAADLEYLTQMAAGVSDIGCYTQANKIREAIAEISALRAAAVGAAEIVAENARLREAIAWTLEVTPDINDFGQATVCLAPAEFDRMRELASAKQ